MKKRLRKTILSLAAWLLIYAVMVGVAYLVPVPGSDWVHHFEPRYKLEVYPPWTLLIPALIPGIPFITALTLTGLLYCLRARKANRWQVLAAFSALPLFWCVWLGQIDAVPMLGLAFLPWGIPLVLIKPQATAWYLWVWWRKHKRRWLIALGVLAFLGLSLLIWGWWPVRMILPVSYFSDYNLSAWRIHWLLAVGLGLAALLETDPERAMALGILASPYVQGNSFLLLLPVMSRLKGWPLFAVWAASWVGVLALVFGDQARLLAMLFPLTLWLVLFLVERKQRKQPVLPADPAFAGGAA